MEKHWMRLSPDARGNPSPQDPSMVIQKELQGRQPIPGDHLWGSILTNNLGLPEITVTDFIRNVICKGKRKLCKDSTATKKNDNISHTEPQSTNNLITRHQRNIYPTWYHVIKGKNRQEGFICWIAAHTLISSRGIPREGAIGSFWACKPQKTCQFTAVLLQSHMFYHTEDWASPNWKEMKNNYKFSNHNSRKPHRNEKLECSQCCSPLPETWKPTLRWIVMIERVWLFSSLNPSNRQPSYQIITYMKEMTISSLSSLLYS